MNSKIWITIIHNLSLGYLKDTKVYHESKASFIHTSSIASFTPFVIAMLWEYCTFSDNSPWPKYTRYQTIFLKEIHVLVSNFVSSNNIVLHYMTSSASGQDEPNRALWLATQASKMEPSCLLGTTRCIPHEKFHRKPYNKSFVDQVCSVKMVEYWPSSFFGSLWTSTSFRSINTQKNNLANIQPSWPAHTWSITHTYKTVHSK